MSPWADREIGLLAGPNEAVVVVELWVEKEVIPSADEMDPNVDATDGARVVSRLPERIIGVWTAKDLLEERIGLPRGDRVRLG